MAWIARELNRTHPLLVPAKLERLVSFYTLSTAFLRGI
jgi:hypothetical protein